MAASGAKEIKNRLKSVSGIEQITSAMKLVSASKLRRARKAYDKSNEYLYFVTESIEEIFANSAKLESKFLLGQREIKNSCYIVITSNQGLCGGFNANVLKEATRIIEKRQQDPFIVAIGQKGKDFFARQHYEIKSEYMAPPENISFLDTHTISQPIIEMYNHGEVDEIIMLYNSMVGSMEQSVKAKRLLPYILEEKNMDLKPAKEVDYEPSKKEVFDYLIAKYVEIEIYSAILESATCEHAARHIAMDNATKNARDMISDLSLTYNRVRQGAITQEITEIVGGSEALR